MKEYWWVRKLLYNGEYYYLYVVKEAAIQEGVSIKWGASWNVEDIRQWEGTMEEAMNAYIDLRRSQGRRPFMDGPHFELIG